MRCCRREFTTAGVAAGVAAGFNAPIGGLLFAMEDLSSFWTKTLSWQTFFCCVVAAIVAKVLNTAFAAFEYQKQFGTFTVQVFSILPSVRNSTRKAALICPRSRATCLSVPVVVNAQHCDPYLLFTAQRSYSTSSEVITAGMGRVTVIA